MKAASPPTRATSVLNTDSLLDAVWLVVDGRRYGPMLIEHAFERTARLHHQGVGHSRMSIVQAHPHVPARREAGTCL